MKNLISSFLITLACFLIVSVQTQAQKFYSIATVTNQPVSVSITQQPQSQNICLDKDVTFSITAAGTTPITYQWLKNGSEISGATSSSYTINNVATADEGYYFSCEVTNLCRTIESDSAELKVIDLTVSLGEDKIFCNDTSHQLHAIATTNHATESGHPAICMESGYRT